MPDIIIKDEYGKDVVYQGVNKVNFLAPDGSVVSYEYNTGPEPPGPEPTGDYRVRFLDYDGTVLQTCYADKGGSVAFIDPPAHEGMVFQTWNYTAEQLMNITCDIDVGAIFVPVGPGQTEPPEYSDTVLTVRIRPGRPDLSVLCRATASIGWRVDWGDGKSSTDTTSALYVSHTYAEAGEYTVTIARTSGTGVPSVGYSTSPTGTSGGVVGQSDAILTCSIGAGWGGIVGCAFQSCYSLQSVSIPAGVTSIGDYAFQNCRALQAVNIPAGVTSIGKEAFANCYSLQSVSIPAGVTSIESTSFQNCYSLQSVSIPAGVTSIGKEAFSACRSLQSVNIPAGVTSIGDRAFANCDSLLDLYVYPPTPPTAGSAVLTNIYIAYLIHVLPEAVDAYKAASGWSNYANYIVGDLGTTT